MGWGDDLMWLGEAKHLYLKDGKKHKPGLIINTVNMMTQEAHNIGIQVLLGVTVLMLI